MGQMQETEINNTQKKLIHMATASLGLSDGVYRDMLQEQFGVNTCVKLNYQQADRLINDLVKKGFKIKRRRTGTQAGTPVPQRRPQAKNLTYLPSPQQMHVIDHLRKDVTWKVFDGFYRWIEKFLGKKRITNTREAQKVIEALKAIRKRQQTRLDKGTRKAGEEHE